MKLISLFISSNECQAALAEMNDVIKTIANETGSSVFDFASLFPDGDKYYCSDGIHMTVEGATLKAKLLAEFIEKNKLIPNN